MSFAIQKLSKIDGLSCGSLNMLGKISITRSVFGAIISTNACTIKLNKLNPDFVIGNFTWNSDFISIAPDLIFVLGGLPIEFRPQQQCDFFGKVDIEGITYPYILSFINNGAIILSMLSGGSMSPIGTPFPPASEISFES